MPTTPAEAGPQGTARSQGTAVAQSTAYIRGGGGLAIDTRRAVRVIVVSLLVMLTVLVVVLFIEAANQNSRLDSLRQHGVPVNVSVTGCTGVLSGTGSTVSSFSCRGSFSLDGHTYNEVIGGNSQPLLTGTTVRAVTVPGHPSRLATAASVSSARPKSDVYVTPAVLLGVLVVGLGVTARFWRSGKGPTALAAVAPAAVVPSADAPSADAPAPAPVDFVAPVDLLASPDLALRQRMASFVLNGADERSVTVAVSVPGNAQIRKALNSLLPAAIAAGTIRADANADDILCALQGVWLVADEQHRAARLLDLLMDGLRYGAPGSRATPPAEPPSGH